MTEDKVITATGTITYKEYKQFTRPAFLIFLLIGVAIMYGIVNYLFTSISLIGKILLTLFYSIFVYFIIKILFKRYYEGLFKKREHTYKIDDQGLTRTNGERVEFYNWPSIQRIKPIKKSYKIYMYNSALFMLPKAFFETEPELNEFENKFKSMGKMKKS